MKIVLFTLLTSLSFSALAVAGDLTDCPNCPQEMRNTAEQAIPGMKIIRGMAGVHRQLTPEEALGNKICMSYRRKEASEKVERSIADHIKDQNENAKIDPKSMVDFINESNDFLTCDDSNRDDGRRHVFKEAMVESNMVQQMFYKFLFKLSKKAKVKVNMNPVEKIGDHFETPLDFLLLEQAKFQKKSPKWEELEDLKYRIVKFFDAKKFSELDKDTREHYTKETMFAAR